MKTVAIFGPPGTGKTRKLVEIAGREVEERKSPTLYLSFTRAAAQEARSRVNSSLILPSTIHSLAFSTLNMNRASVVDRIKLAAFGKETGIPFKGSEPGSDEVQEGDEYQTVLEFAHNRIIPHMEAWHQFGRPGTQARFEYFIESYVKWKQTYGYMDFDDMLTRFVEDPNMRIQDKPVIILDEAQDLSPLQWMAFIKICDRAKRVYIAGDDDQAIFEWSGANPHGMIGFAEENDGEVRILDKSWRVPRLAHNLAHVTCLAEISKRVAKRFAPRDGDGTITRYGDIWDIDLYGFDVTGGGLVLVRDRFRMEEVKHELNRLMVPYDVLGGSSPWTNRTATALRKGEEIEISPFWQDFYRMADLTRPIRITLATIHQAKGRESDRVILDLNLQGAPLMHLSRDADPERRVLYVGLTRVKEQLLICGSSPLL